MSGDNGECSNETVSVRKYIWQYIIHRYNMYKYSMYKYWFEEEIYIFWFEKIISSSLNWSSQSLNLTKQAKLKIGKYIGRFLEII